MWVPSEADMYQGVTSHNLRRLHGLWVALMDDEQGSTHHDEPDLGVMRAYHAPGKLLKAMLCLKDWSHHVACICIF